jgi:hypothetical protein
VSARARRLRRLVRRADKAAKRLVSDVAQSVDYEPLMFGYRLRDGRLVTRREHFIAVHFRRR